MKGSKTEKQNKIALYILHENAAGYSLFLLDEGIGEDVNAVQESVNDFDRFEKVVKFVDFHPFESSQDAVEEQNAVTLY
ncbi:nucleolar protein 56-like protein, partial [Tanacetum coccineum]